MLRKLAVAFALPFVPCTAALADAEDCTAEARGAWKSIADVTKAAVAEGYVVSQSKVEGTCYEFEARDKDGKLWDLFYNPADGKLVKKEAQ